MLKRLIHNLEKKPIIKIITKINLTFKYTACLKYYHETRR